MKLQPHETDELHDLAAASCTGEITREQFARLTQMLRNSREAQEVYIDYTRLDGGLRWEYGAARRNATSIAQDEALAEADEPIAIATPRRATSSLRRPTPGPRRHKMIWTVYGAAAALLLAGIAVAVYVAMFAGHDPQQDQPRSRARVATLTDAQGVTWVSDLLNPGDEIASGTIATDSGDAEFVFASGAQVSISGRVEMHIDNPMRVSMNRGRATFICPHDAVGFTVVLPNGVRVVDLGTEFTIDQQAERATVHVTRGRVRIHGVSDDGKPVQREMIGGELATVVQGRFSVRSDGAGPVPPDVAIGDPSRTPPPLTVAIGDPGNAPDDTGYGAVAYEYRIGKYEVTNSQYCDFLNATARDDRFNLYNEEMAGDYGGIVRSGAPGAYVYALKDGAANRPVNFVSWLDAVRYANWLSNGGGDGDTESGAYAIRGGQVTVPDHAALAEAPGVKWVLPTEDEWYKAAYYDTDKDGAAGYWRFATRTDEKPRANFNTDLITDAGDFPASAYGTFDQNGNMWEWNELMTERGRGLRGGSFYLFDKLVYMRSSTRYDYIAPSDEKSNYGFRVAALGRGGIR